MEKISVFLFTISMMLLSIIPQGNAEINLKRTDDLKYINFNKDEHFKLQVDVSQVLREMIIVNEHLCSLACVEHNECKSANLKRTANGEYHCQLLNTDKYQEGQASMISDNTFHYMSIKTPCKSSPCLNSGKCIPLYEEGKYTCSCGVSYTGTHCETLVPWKGFEKSSIIGSNTVYLQSLLQWIGSTPASGAQWDMCFSSSLHGFSSTTFHSLCDNKKYTITIVQVGIYIFGGYSDIPWVSSGSYYSSSSCWLFSMKNKDNVAPFRTFSTKSATHAIYSSSTYGPTFGGGHDLYIINGANSGTGSYTNLGHSYQPPSGYTYGSSNIQSLLAGTYRFTVTNYEVFYKL